MVPRFGAEVYAGVRGIAAGREKPVGFTLTCKGMDVHTVHIHVNYISHDCIGRAFMSVRIRLRGAAARHRGVTRWSKNV